MPRSAQRTYLQFTLHFPYYVYHVHNESKDEESLTCHSQRRRSQDAVAIYSTSQVYSHQRPCSLPVNAPKFPYRRGTNPCNVTLPDLSASALPRKQNVDTFARILSRPDAARTSLAPLVPVGGIATTS